MPTTDSPNGDTQADVVTETVLLVAAAEAAPSSISALVVADGKIPAKPPAIVVVAESRKDDGSDDKIIYAAGATYYLRMTPDLDMGCPAERLMTIGDNLPQYAFSGFAPSATAVNVGPVHPAYAAINFAYNLGARAIDVSGLSAEWKTRLTPFIEGLNDNADYGVTVRLL